MYNGPWQAFERMMERYLMHSEAFDHSELVGGSNDKGADVVGFQKKTGKSIVIQCKYSEKITNLSPKVADEVLNALDAYNADFGYIATNRNITVSVVKKIKDLRKIKADINVLGYKKLENLGNNLNEFTENHRKPPRCYQEEAFDIIRENYLAHKKSSWFLMATGLGKTRVAALIIEDWLSRFENSEIAFLVPTLPLVYQTEKALWPYLSKFTHTHVLTGSEKPSFAGGVTIAAYDSFKNWIDTYPGRYDLIIFDEAHHAPADTYVKALKTAAPKFLLGMTATPWRGDKRILDDVFGEKCYEMSIVEGMQKGYLAEVDYQMYADTIDWKDVSKMLKEGITIKDLNKKLFILPRDNAIADHLKTLKENNELTQGLCFCPRQKHADLFAANLRSVGISAQSFHSGIDSVKRAKILKDFYKKKIQILVTVDALNEGYDVPDVDLVVFLKATHSRRIFLQQLGRGLRISKDKTKVRVLDYVSDFRRLAEGQAINNEGRNIANNNNGDQEIRYLDDIVKFKSSLPKSFYESYDIDWEKISELGENEKFNSSDLFPHPDILED